MRRQLGESGPAIQQSNIGRRQRRNVIVDSLHQSLRKKEDFQTTVTRGKRAATPCGQAQPGLQTSTAASVDVGFLNRIRRDTQQVKKAATVRSERKQREVDNETADDLRDGAHRLNEAAHVLESNDNNNRDRYGNNGNQNDYRHGNQNDYRPGNANGHGHSYTYTTYVKSGR